MTRTLAIFSDRVITGSGEIEVRPALISIRDTHITAVEHIPRDEVDWSTGQTEDLGQRLVTPAFVNGHTHLSMCMFRGLGLDAMANNIVEDTYYRVESGITAADVEAFSRMGAYESLLCGVGTVWDHYYHADAVARAVSDVGLCAVIAPTLQDRFGPGTEQVEQQIEATMRINRDTHLKSRGIFAALGPHATDTVSDVLWQRVAELADEHDLVIHAHVAQSMDEYQRSIEGSGCSPIERLHRTGVLAAGPGMLLVHSLFVSKDDLTRLNGERHALGYCPYSQLQFGFPAAFEDWTAAGIPIQLGTDCGACNDTMNVQQEIRLLANGRGFALSSSHQGEQFRRTGTLSDALALEAERKASWKPERRLTKAGDLLRGVWQTPGQFAPGSTFGELAPGHRANLAIWDLEHPSTWPATSPLRALTMSDMAPALWGMMLNGLWLGERGHFAQSIMSSNGYQHALDEANRRLAELRDRLGL